MYGRRFATFGRDRKGNFAMMTAILMVPLLTGAGMMIDYANMTRQKSKLQNAVDSAVLMAGGEHRRTGNLPPSSKVVDMIEANFGASVQIVEYAIEDEEIKLRASTNTDALFMDIIGRGQQQQAAEATVPVTIGTKAEIAMVLDTTGSMGNDGRMASLKTVATDFVNDTLDLLPNPTSDAIKIGIVPFANYVNVGLSQGGQPWLDVPADETTTSCYMTRPLISKSGCTTQTGTSTNDGVPYTYTYETCTHYDYGPEEEVCNNNSKTWRGCVGSRAPALNVADQAYSVRVPGLLDISCTSEMQPLTNQRSLLLSTISGLPTSRKTYIGAGVSWANRLLSRKAPFTEAEPYGGETKKFMIVMSDGDNTLAPNVGTDSHLHENSDTAYADDQTKKACKEARDEGVTVYTIAFGTSVSSEGKAVLEACAGDPSRFYDAKSASDLQESFDAIAAAIFTLRLTS